MYSYENAQYFMCEQTPAICLNMFSVTYGMIFYLKKCSLYFQPNISQIEPGGLEQQITNSVLTV